MFTISSASVSLGTRSTASVAPTITSHRRITGLGRGARTPELDLLMAGFMSILLPLPRDEIRPVVEQAACPTGGPSGSSGYDSGTVGCGMTRRHRANEDCKCGGQPGRATVLC